MLEFLSRSSSGNDISVDMVAANHKLAHHGSHQVQDTKFYGSSAV